MFQSEAILEREASAARESFEGPIMLQVADMAPARNDEDALFDSWLASLGDGELDLILGSLSRDRSGQLESLEPTA
jgi:hypothetical protein